MRVDSATRREAFAASALLQNSTALQRAHRHNVGRNSIRARTVLVDGWIQRWDAQSKQVSQAAFFVHPSAR